MPPVLTSISPVSGPPGALVTATGAGFDAGSQIGCPTLVPTTFVNSTTLTAVVPGEITGADGSQIAIGVFVRNSDGTSSAVVTFTVEFPQTRLQAWTKVGVVVKAVPGFQRGGDIKDDDIQNWIAEVAQEIAATMVKRALPLDPSVWPAQAQPGMPTAQGLLEMINRAGAAARLASAIASNFTAGQWGVQKDLQTQYERQLKALGNGDYDKLFLVAAATTEPGPLLGAETGHCPTFRKDQVF